MSEKKRLSRRTFLKSIGAVGIATTLAGVLPVYASQSQNTHNNHTSINNRFRGRMFFTDTLEFETLSHVCERIFPKDKIGPGAIELAVPYFIDNQLAAGYGYNAREYVAGPYFKGEITQGYQSPMIKRDIFKYGILALNLEANKRFKKDFPNISDEQKDNLLVLFESGVVDFNGVSSSYFFSLLKSAVLAGVYSDPIYNGNNDMKGWMLKEYPGAQMSYKDIILDSKFIKISPISLSSMQ